MLMGGLARTGPRLERAAAGGGGPGGGGGGSFGFDSSLPFSFGRGAGEAVGGAAASGPGADTMAAAAVGLGDSFDGSETMSDLLPRCDSLFFLCLSLRFHSAAFSAFRSLTNAIAIAGSPVFHSGCRETAPREQHCGRVAINTVDEWRRDGD